jgi:hypothetical protein
MWAGQNPSMGQPVRRPLWSAGPPVVRPAAGWYAVPVVLVLIAVAATAIVLGVTWNASQAAGGPPAKGDPAAGIQVQLVGGHAYFLYVQPSTAPPTSCTVASAITPATPVALTRENSWNAADRPGLRYAATFTAPASGRARLTCQGAANPMLVTPDDTVHGVIGLTVLLALGVVGAGAVFFLVIFLRRRSVRRRLTYRLP